ncbi:chromate transporter [Melghirimyces profundicolus]|uniref:Chromate transporter n=1 Tax=Melghirimyces profundicolus TaxID=1242148 RepID=A0A2T6C8L5_9BACL|nr:chromate transporter [Melghirimyces profundicolus]PTX64664.1 chromate transporter [Melghirimyces profundicolus]
MSYLQLITGFIRAGVLGYGGGPSVIPLIRYEAVEKYGWMEEKDFAEVLALANALPGPIATKMAAYIGYRVKGTRGALTAILSHILPTVLVMIGFLGVLYKFKDSPVISGMIRGVGPVIGVMLGMFAYEFFDKAKTGLGLSVTVALTAVGGTAVLSGVHPAILIFVFLAGAFTYATWGRRSRDPSEGGKERP